MEELTKILYQFIARDNVAPLVRAVILLVFGLTIAKFAGRTIDNTLRKYNIAQHGFVAGRVVFYSITVLILISVLRQFGVDFTVLLGAAGVFTVAIAFASQTSASNLISGLFLMVE